ncbi:hypothetical protein V501_00082, partial [Pseudogymnoascus sp. VKM F-4519 (FW-2642)]
MSYQHPPPPSSGADFKLSLRSIGNLQIPPAIPPELSQQVPDSNLFSQELNQHASDQGGKIKRSSSTLNIRDQAVADATLAASAEKRRNKLSYHRTSVACGHCRRRKIRCILAPGDLQNRCASCIRLKKDCNFYAVNQPPQPELKDQRGAPSGRGLGGASSSASPSDTQNGLSYPNMGMPPCLGSSDIKRLKDDGFAPENRGFVFGAQNEYQPNTAVWLQSKLPPSTRPVADASGYWRVYNQEPLAPAFPMFSETLNQPQQQNWSPGAIEPGPQEGLNWVVPQRSVLFEHFENLPQQAPYQEAFTTRTSPPGAETYMHGIPWRPYQQLRCGIDDMSQQRSIFSWRDIVYDIHIKDKPRRLLDHVSGWARPGTLTALMGVSGAGKTTLLDVLAHRTSFGVVTGDMLVNGKVLNSSFQRKIGYVQQQDVHLETAT